MVLKQALLGIFHKMKKLLFGFFPYPVGIYWVSCKNTKLKKKSSTLEGQHSKDPLGLHHHVFSMLNDVSSLWMSFKGHSHYVASLLF
jgi:hypothetical protein